jgi:hypothetical protein
MVKTPLLHRLMGSLMALFHEAVSQRHNRRLQRQLDQARHLLMTTLMKEFSCFRYGFDEETILFRLNNLGVVFERCWGEWDSIHFCKDGVCVAHWVDDTDQRRGRKSLGETQVSQSCAFLTEDVDYVLNHINNGEWDCFEFCFTEWAMRKIECPLGTIIFDDQFSLANPEQSPVFHLFAGLSRQRLSDDLGL